MQLESSVARVLLSVVVVAAAAAAEFSCARNCLATSHDNTLYPPRTYLVVFFQDLGAIHHVSDLCITSGSRCDSSFIGSLY